MKKCQQHAKHWFGGLSKFINTAQGSGFMPKCGSGDLQSLTKLKRNLKNEVNNDYLLRSAFHTLSRSQDISLVLTILDGHRLPSLVDSMQCSPRFRTFKNAIKIVYWTCFHIQSHNRSVALLCSHPQPQINKQEKSKPSPDQNMQPACVRVGLLVSRSPIMHGLCSSRGGGWGLGEVGHCTLQQLL